MGQSIYSKSGSCNCMKMRRASRAVTHFYDKLLEPSGLKATQYSLLANVKSSGPISVNELSETLRLERTTLVRNLKLLEDRGFIENSSEEHSKMHLLSLTDAGTKAVSQARPYWEQAQETIDALFSEQEMQLFNSVLFKLDSLNR